MIALVIGLVAIVAALGAPAPAVASSGTPVIADCNSHDTLTQTYSVAQLENALQTMPAYVNEYTACHDIIERALLAQESKLHRSGGSGASSSGGSFLPTPLIVVLGLLIAAALLLGGLSLRRRRALRGQGPSPSASS